MSQLISELPRLLPLNPSRNTVYQQDKSEVRGIHFGLLVRRGRGISRADYQRPEARQTLHALATCRPVNHPYVAIQVNMLTTGQQLPEHVDARNIGDSWVLAFGSYQGGALAVQEKNGWREIDNHLKWVRIPSGVLHKVSTVSEGTRYSIVLYSPVGAMNTVMADQGRLGQELANLGYPISDVQWLRSLELQAFTDSMDMTDKQQTVNLTSWWCIFNPDHHLFMYQVPGNA